MKTRLLLLSFSALTVLPLAASAEVWLCKRGNTEEYTNVGDTKTCKKMDLPGISTVPAVKTAPRASSASTNLRPADFPKPDADTQRGRDDDRRKIFESELKEQEQKLAQQQKEFNNGQPERRTDERNYAKYQERVTQMRDAIARTEANIASIKRELSRVTTAN